MFNLKILTPTKIFFTGEVEMVTIPAFDGEMGILPDHISMVVELVPGLVKIYQGNTVIQSVFIYGGFAEIHNNQVDLLIEDAYNKADVDFAHALTKMEEVTLKLLNVDDAEYQKTLEKELAIYQKMVEISKE